MTLFSKPSIIISNHEYQPLLFQFKNAHPDYDLKVLTKEEIFNHLAFSYKKDPIPFLISLGYSYSKAKRYVDILRKANDFSKNETLTSLFNRLKEQGYVSFDQYGVLMFSNKDVLVLEMDEDIEIKNVLTKNNIVFSNVHISDLGIKENEFDHEGNDKIIGPLVKQFDSKYQQFFYIYSDIRNRILKDPTLKDKIHLLVEPGDQFFEKIIGEILGIKNLLINRTCLISNNDVANKLGKIFVAKKFEFTEQEKENIYLKAMSDVVEKYGLNKLEFDFAFSNLNEILSATRYNDYTASKGISSGDNFYIMPDKLIYVTNFKFDSFYKEYSDDNVFDDETLLGIGINPSYVKTLLDRRLKFNYIKYNNVALFSYSSRHLTDSIYNSQFISDKSLGWENNIVHQTLNDSGVYTEEASKIYLCEQFDKAFDTSIEEEINSYNHDFKPFDVSKDFKKDTYSITDIERFYSCPFKYYLSKVLPYDDEDYSARIKGKLAHKIMEKIFDDDFDFEVEFEKGLKMCENSAQRDGYKIDKKTYAWIEVFHHWMKQFSVIFRNNIHNMNYVPLLGNKGTSEVRIPVEVYDDATGESHLFNCQIDRILFTENNGKNYYTILDYKTGAEEFDLSLIFAGQNLQLPLYYKAIETSFDKKDYVGDAIFGGIGIFHNYFRSFNKIVSGEEISQKSIQAASCVQGAFLSSEEYGNSIDRTSFTKKGTPSKGEFVNRNGLLFTDVDCHEPFFEANESGTKMNFTSMTELTTFVINNIIEQIEKNMFVIQPLSLNVTNYDPSRLVCSYCPYRNICFRNGKDMFDVYEFLQRKYLNQAIKLMLDEEEKEEEHLDA